MARIVYYAFPSGEVQGGQKMILRHVETLRELGFDAVCWMNRTGRPPSWMTHRAPIVVETPPQPDDILVIPDDSPNAITTAAGLSQRTVIFSQNPNTFGALAVPALDRFPPDRLPPFIAVGWMLAGVIKRTYPQSKIERIPCFADERVFKPGATQDAAICLSPRKRPQEAVFIRNMFRRLHARHADRPWRTAEGVPERSVAEIFASSDLFLSLSRLESVGMTPLEAMACGCVCAGFTGIGGREYATAENGFWAPEDDNIAAVDLLAAAADLLQSDGPELKRMREAGRATAEQWSYARFRVALEASWMRLAPEARVRSAAGV